MSKAHKLLGKALSLVFACAIAVTAMSSMSAIPAAAATAPLSMQDLLKSMQPGWNLANALEASGGETSWGSPLTTEAMIKGVADAGFKSVRVPITWNVDNRVGAAPNYTIDTAFLTRVKQIVDWVNKYNMVAIIDVHHDDSGWWIAPTGDGSTFSQDVLDRYTAIWTQVAAYFKGYDTQKLLFEALNEPRFDGDWWLNNPNYATALHTLQDTFYNTVRKSGGNNTTRPLVVSTYLASIWLPDTITGEYAQLVQKEAAYSSTPNIIVTVHDYGPDNFSNGTKQVFDGTVKSDTKARVDYVNDNLVAKGIPVFIGESGILAYDNGISTFNYTEWLKYWQYFTTYASSKGLTFMMWDAGQDHGEFNRNTLTWRSQEFLDITMGRNPYVEPPTVAANNTLTVNKNIQASGLMTVADLKADLSKLTAAQAATLSEIDVYMAPVGDGNGAFYLNWQGAQNIWAGVQTSDVSGGYVRIAVNNPAKYLPLWSGSTTDMSINAASWGNTANAYTLTLNWWYGSALTISKVVYVFSAPLNAAPVTVNKNIQASGLVTVADLKADLSGLTADQAAALAEIDVYMAPVGDGNGCFYLNWQGVQNIWAGVQTSDVSGGYVRITLNNPAQYLPLWSGSTTDMSISAASWSNAANTYTLTLNWWYGNPMTISKVVYIFK